MYCLVLLLYLATHNTGNMVSRIPVNNPLSGPSAVGLTSRDTANKRSKEI